MANKKVSILRLCKTADGWKRYPALFGHSGKLKPNYALVNGDPCEFPTGHYELRFYERRKLKYENVGNNPQGALNALNKKRLVLEARRSAHEAGTKIIETAPGRVTLTDAMHKFLKLTYDKGSHVAAVAYRPTLTEFTQSTEANYPDEVTEAHVLKYHGDLKRRGSEGRTIFNKHTHLKSFLRWCGVDTKVVFGKAPRYNKAMPEVYSTSELKSFFASCKDPYHQVVFQTLLQTGLRMQEAMFLEWEDLQMEGEQPTVTLRSKPKQDFTLKDYEERSVPLPTELVQLLRAWREKPPNTRLVLGTPANDSPNWKWLQMLKRIVHRSGLDCRKCEGCKRNECERWFLHKFRATYCTMLLRSGMDLRTVQHLMGHSDLQSTMRYLAPAENVATQARVNAISWGL